MAKNLPRSLRKFLRRRKAEIRRHSPRESSEELIQKLVSERAPRYNNAGEKAKPAV